MNDAFAILGLPRDADERAIKRAYAALLRVHRPDEDPVGFQRINEAYAQALELYRWRTSLSAEDLHEMEAVAAALVDAPVAHEVGTRVRVPVRPQPVVTSATADARADVPVVDVTAFLDALRARAMACTADELAQWLDAHPDLFDMAFKQDVTPHVVTMLEDHREVPGRQVEVILAFFGLDNVARANTVSVERVTALLERANPGIVARRRLQRDDHAGLWPVVLLMFILLVNLARCMGPDR